MKSIKKVNLKKRMPRKKWIKLILSFIGIILILIGSIIYIKIGSKENNISNNDDIEITPIIDIIPTPTPLPLPSDPKKLFYEIQKHYVLYKIPYNWMPKYSNIDLEENDDKPLVDGTGADPENKVPEAEYVDLYPEIPLENEVEFYIYEKCKEYGLNFRMVLGLIYAESEFNHRCRDNKNTNGTYDVGLFQINSNNFEWMERIFGKQWDEYMLYDNINAGLYILNYAQSVTDNEHGMLMVYNMGENGAKKKWAEGILTTEYSKKVMTFANNLAEVDYPVNFE